MSESESEQRDGEVLQVKGLPFAIQLPFGMSADNLPSDFIESLLAELSLMDSSAGRVKLAAYNSVQDACALIGRSDKIVVLSGAGLSVSAGIPDFRSERSGLYAILREKYKLADPTDLFGMRFFLNKPELFYDFARDLWPGFGPITQYYPTLSHYFLAELQRRGKLLRLYTQNIDTLEMRAGIGMAQLITCHGSFVTASCVNCEFQVSGVEIEASVMAQAIPFCPYCMPERSESQLEECKQAGLGKHVPIVSAVDNADCSVRLIRVPKWVISDVINGTSALQQFDTDTLQIGLQPLKSEDARFRILSLSSSDPIVLEKCTESVLNSLKSVASFGVFKPDVVFFGEPLPETYHSQLDSDLAECDLILIMGTSLQVGPVNTIPERAPDSVPQLLINREVVGAPHLFDINLLGDADVVCEHLLSLLRWDVCTAVRQSASEKSTDTDDTRSIHVLSTVRMSAAEHAHSTANQCYHVFRNGVLPSGLVAAETETEGKESKSISSDVAMTKPEKYEESEEKDFLAEFLECSDEEDVLLSDALFYH